MRHPMKRFVLFGSLCASLFSSQVPSYAETSVMPARFGYAADGQNPTVDKTKTVEPAKVCTEFGEGYFYVPGTDTDTCLRISGEVRADYRFYEPAPLNYSTTKPKATRNRAQDEYDFRGEGRIKRVEDHGWPKVAARHWSQSDALAEAHDGHPG